MKKSVLVVFGGQSSEHIVSCMSAINVIKNIDTERYDVTLIGITEEGKWLLVDSVEQIEDESWRKNMTTAILSPDATEKSVIVLKDGKAEMIRIDVVFPVLHGLWGEDGTIQGLFEMANIPYASTGVLGSAIGMDKIAMKLLLRGAGYPVLDFVWFTREQIKKDRKAVVERVEKEIKYPAFIKPAALGSSIGVSRAKNREELERALDVAASYDRRVLVEVGVVHPVEINCAALGYGEEVQTSVCEMPIPSSNDTFLDFWQKYLRNASTKGEESRGMKSLSRAVPAPIGEELTKRIQTMTAEIFKLMDCCGTIRVDYILDQNDVLFVNEPNTIPGSLAFYLWKAGGLDFPKLVEKMVEDALRKHADKNSSVFAYDSSILKKVASGSKGAKR